MKKINKKILFILLGVFIVIASILLFNKFKNKDDIDFKKISVVVFDQYNEIIYDKKIETKEKYLIDFLKNTTELKIISKTGDYGEYIISILDKEEGDNYYWNYYINGEYATVGVSSLKIEDGKEYSFKLEKFE